MKTEGAVVEMWINKSIEPQAFMEAHNYIIPSGLCVGKLPESKTVSYAITRALSGYSYRQNINTGYRNMEKA